MKYNQIAHKFYRDLFPVWHIQPTRADLRVQTPEGLARLRVPQGCVIDRTHGHIYNTDSANVVRLKHALLLVGNPTINGVKTLMAMGSSAGAAAVQLSRGEVAGAARQLGRLLSLPVMLGVMQGCCLVGLVCPFAGRRMFARAEGCLAHRLAPCFAPIFSIGAESAAADLAARDRHWHLWGKTVHLWAGSAARF